MIPFWSPDKIVLIQGVLEFHMFGLLVGIGVLAGSFIAQRRAVETHLDPRLVGDLALWVVLVGFFFAHQVSLFFYFPERIWGTPCETTEFCMSLVAPANEIAANPSLVEGVECRPRGRCNDGSWVEILKIANGISSFGGFLGAAIAFLVFVNVRRIVMIPRVLVLQGGKGKPILKYADTLAVGFALGWFFGRLGCFVAHDHIGMVTDSFWGVKFPDDFRGGELANEHFGGDGYTTRYDLGFMEVLWSAAMFAWFWIWGRKRWRELRPGFFTAMMMILYAPYRIYLDTLRATDISDADTRYLAETFPPGITPGQIGAVLLFLLGCAIWWWGGRRKADEAYMAWTDEPEGASEPEERPTGAGRAAREKKKRASATSKSRGSKSAPSKSGSSEGGAAEAPTATQSATEAETRPDNTDGDRSDDDAAGASGGDVEDNADDVDAPPSDQPDDTSQPPRRSGNSKRKRRKR